MRRPAIAVVLLILSVFSFLTFLNGTIPPANATSASFSFAASGDMGSLTVSTSTTSLNRLATANPSFFLSLGDMSYDPSVTGDVWCGQFASAFSSIEVMPGDHDTGGHNSATFGETHSYERYLNGCPFNLGAPIVCGPVQDNCYGKEYYFDYPAINPIARFIFASPKIYNITGVCTSSRNCSSQTGQPCTDQYGCWQYDANDIHYNWTSNAIDDARARGIGWVIVATHKLCISSVDATCSMGIAFFNLLIQKKVDLIIEAHDNAYERSKQLALNGGKCPRIGTDGNGYAVYNSGCVVDNGAGNYTRGAGSVVVVNGAWINDLYSVNASASTPANAAEAPFFAKLMGKNTPGAGLGFAKYTVSEGRIDVQTSFSGSFSDSFSILNGPSPAQTSPWPALVANPGIGEKEFKFAWQRSTFFAGGFYWAFWVNSGTCEGQNGCLYYSSSADGVTWATPTNLGVHVNREDFSVTTDGTHAYYTRYNETSYFASTCNRALLFRQGSISGSSISWQKENVVIRGNLTTAFINPNLKLDSNGQAWIGYLYSSTSTCGGNGNEQPRAIHSSGTNYGSWNSQTVLSTAHNGNWAVDLTSLGNGAMYFTYWLDSSPTTAIDLHGRLYNSTFFPDQQISSPSDKVDGNAFVFSGGATVYAVWLDENLQRLVFASTTFRSPSTETWNTPVTIAKSECCSSSSGYGAQPWSASFDPATKSISMFWYNYTRQEVDLYHGLGNTWTGPVPYWATSQASILSTVTSFQYASMVGANGAVAIGAMFMDGQAIGGNAHSLKYVVDTTVLARSVSVNFAMSPNNPLMGQQITFTANATGATPPYSYSWNFGDGFSRSTSNIAVTHTYSNQGTFLVRLNSTDSAGVTGTSSRNVSIFASTPFALTTTQDGRIYKYFQNGTLTFTARPVGSALRQVAWKPDGSYALIVGDGGVVYTYDGQTLTSISSTTIGKTNLNTVAWKPDGSYALIGGQNGLVFKYNGTAVSKITDPANKNIFAISWNPNGNSALIVGEQGTALVYAEPSNITTVSSGTGQPLNTVTWNPNGTYALTGGGNGAVLLYNGTLFSPLSTTGLTPSGKNIRFIAFNPINNLGILVGDGGLVWSYDGTNLASLTSGTANNLFSLSWIAGTAYIVGQNGIMLSSSGTTVTKLSSGVTFNFLSIAWKPQPVSVSFTYSPSNPSTQSPISFTAIASGGTSPYNFGWTFGDGSTATGANIVHSYSSPGSYTVVVTVTDNRGATNRTSSIVTVQPPASPIVTVNSPTPNPASTGVAVSLSFTVSSGTSVTGIVVNWGDGTPADNLGSTSTTDSHSYTSIGSHTSQTFTITVTATTAGGSGSGFTTETINDRAPVTTVSSVTPSPATTGQIVTADFNATDPDGNIASYTVNWGDGTSDSLLGTATSDSHTYASTGTFSVTVTATDNSGSTSQATGSIVVQNPLTPPTVSVNSPSPNPVTTGATVNVAFTVTSSSTVNGVTVNWGDGSPVDNLVGTATSDTHVYSSTGASTAQTFTITVMASNTAGSGSGSTSETVNDRPPGVSVSSISSPVGTGQLVNLTFSATDPDGGVSSVSVNWGDGKVDLLSGTATSDTHIYASTGSSTSKVFAVTVTATDNSGSSGRATSSVTVNDRPPTVTVAGVSPNPALAGTTVTISFSTSDPDGTISSIVVNWGDGSASDLLPGTATSDSHSYGSGGAFTISVTATDNSGSSATGTTTENVMAPFAPTVTINSVSPNPASTGQTVTVTFTVSSTISITGLTVNWGDGTTDTLGTNATSDTHTYVSTGSVQTQTFTVLVTATNAGGSGSASTSASVSDRPPSTSLTSVSPNPANTGVTVTATFSSSDPDGSTSSIGVNWGDGTSTDTLAGTATSDSHSYSLPGTYTITLTATDNSGSTSHATGSETIQTPVTPPTVNVNSPTPNPAATGTSVSLTFTVTSSTPVSSITVNWGDGTLDSLPGTATSDPHAYSSTGAVQSQTFTITVTATNSAGPGSGTATETVNDRPPTVLISSLIPNPSNTGQVVTVSFSAADSDGTVSSITIDWGDGTVHTVASTSTSDTHSYAAAGTFTVAVGATDNSGSTGQTVATESVKAASTPYALATTSDGKVYKVFTNGTMTLVGQPVTTQLRSVSWKPDGSYALISGDAAVLLKYDGTTLTTIPTPISTGFNFWSVSWRPDGSYALIAGTSGILLKYDGASATVISDPNTQTIFAVNWNPAGTYALLVGRGGTALVYDGTTVRSLTSGTSFDLDAVGWNPNGQYALVGGFNGTILRFDGTQFTTINTNGGLAGTNAIKSIAFNTQGTLALLVGDSGMVLTYNGSTLTRLNQATFSWLYAVSWGPNGTAYIVGNSANELTYTNGTLTKLVGVPAFSFRAIAWKPQ